MKKKLLAIGLVWPEPQSSAAGARMLQLIDALEGYEITFASAAQRTPYSFDFSTTRISTVDIVLNDSSFDVFVKNLAPDVVLYDRFVSEEQFGWRVSKNCPAALTILDTEDLHFLRDARLSAVREKRALDTGDLFSELAKREMASIYRCDLSLIISEYEMDLLQEVFKIPAQLLLYLPFMFDVIDESEFLPYELRQDFLFLGNFLHKPNVDAVLWLREQIWPLIHERLPEARMQVYGAYPSRRVLEAQDSGSGFYVAGRAESALSVMAGARVMLAPLRAGAGLKGKLAEAMRCGTPSVTTSIGAEGMAIDRQWSGFVEDTPRAFAERAIALYRDSSLWENAVAIGKSIFNRRFDFRIHKKTLICRIDLIVEHLKAHRNSNFTGQIMRSQTVNSLKYLSRWIEEKNRI